MSQKRKKASPQERLRHIDQMTGPTPQMIDNQRAVLSLIKDAATETMAELEQALTTRPLNAVAWLSRNLLELALWSEYCHRSPFNSQNFMLDAGRDVMDAMNVPELDQSGGEPLSAKRDEILRKAKADGFLSLDSRYTDVADVAQFLDKANYFKFWNKMLSKFAHPTAFVLLTPLKELDERYRRGFYHCGANCAEAVQTFADKILRDAAART